MTSARDPTPVVIIGDRAFPITAAQADLARRHLPIGQIAGRPSQPHPGPRPTASASPQPRTEPTMTEADQITAAVAQARDRLPNLPDDYETRAIAAGKTLADVQTDLCAQMTANPRERGKALMRAEVERQGLTKGGRFASSAAPASSPARGAALMAAEVARRGMTPNRR